MSGRAVAVLVVLATTLPATAWAVAGRGGPAPGPPPRVFAFVSRADGRELEQLERHGARIDVAAPNWYAVDVATGAVMGTPDPPLNRVAALAGVPLWPVVNGRTGRSPRPCMPAWQRSAAEGIRAAAAAGRHPGMTLDLEELAPSQRPCLTSFVGRLARALRTDGRRLAVYAPRTDPAYDWTALGSAADLLVVSGYNEHWAGSRPGPVTTSAGLDAVAGRAASVGRRGVAVAIGAFGYRWPRSGRGALVGSVDGERLARSPGARITRREGATGVTLPDGSRVWYETAGALRSRIATIRSHRLRWVALFSLGREPESFWDGLGD